MQKPGGGAYEYLNTPNEELIGQVNGESGTLLFDSARNGSNRGAAVGGNAEGQAALLLGHHFLDFWMNLCICQNLITEEAQGGKKPVYQVSFLFTFERKVATWNQCLTLRTSLKWWQ